MPSRLPAAASRPACSRGRKLYKLLARLPAEVSQPHPVPSPCLRRGVSPIPDPSPSGRAQLRSADLNSSGKGNEACAPTGLPLKTTQQSCDLFAGKACPCGWKPFITGCYTSPEVPPRFYKQSVEKRREKEGNTKRIRRGSEEKAKKGHSVTNVTNVTAKKRPHIPPHKKKRYANKHCNDCNVCNAKKDWKQLVARS